MAADGKVTFKYEGDTSGIDKANRDAESKIKTSGQKVDNEIKQTSKNAGNSAAEGVKSGHGKLTSIAKGIGTAFTASFATAGVGAIAFAKKGIETASALAESENVVDVTFGKSAKSVDAWSDKAAKSFGLSGLQARQMNGTLGAMVKSMGLSGEQTEKMSEGLTGLSGDFASFYNIKPEEAFEKIRAGISGETMPLKQLGINMDEANLKAFAMKNGMNGNIKSMTQAQQATLRYNYLMSVTKNTQGDFARTSGSFANQQRILKMELSSLAASAGQQLLPALNELMTTFRKLVMENPQVQAGFKSFFKIIGQLANQALPPLLKLAGQLMPIFQQIVSQFLPPLLKGLGQILPVLMKLITAILPPLLKIIQLLMPIAVKIITTILPPIVKILSMLLPPLIRIISAILPPLLKLIDAVITPLMQLIEMILPPLTKLLVSIAGYIQTFIVPLIQFLAKVISTTLGQAFKDMAPIFNSFVNVVKGVLNFLQDVFKGDWGAVWNDVVGIFTNLWNGITGIAKAPINGIIDMVNGLIGGLDSIHLPSWMGGGGISIPMIPKLAKGGLAYQPQLAMIGDNPHAGTDPEVVAPLSKIESYLTVAVKQAGGGAPQPNIIVQPTPVSLKLDGRLLAQNTTDYQLKTAATRGYKQ